MPKVEPLWTALQKVQSLEFTANSRSNKTGWTGNGSGSVIVETPTPDYILLHESGVWYQDGSSRLKFHNLYRWSRLEDRVRLEHLRFGEKQPVYLFDLAPETDNVWVSVDSHLCRNDHYTARLELENSVIRINWTVTGPEKDEEIVYHYHSQALIKEPGI